jgi:prophage antirepressor-like protein
VWTGATVTVIRHDDRIAIFHRNKIIRRLTADPTKRYQPTGAPRTGRRQPRIVSEPT